jgi:hypothetical protein
MGNEHGRPQDDPAGGQGSDGSDSHSRDTSSHREGSEANGASSSGKKRRDKQSAPRGVSPDGDDDQDGGYESFLKKLDTSQLKHNPDDPIEKYYQVSDKILGMCVSSFFVSVFELRLVHETTASFALSAKT